LAVVRRYPVLAAAAVVVAGCLAFLPVSLASATAWAPWAAPHIEFSPAAVPAPAKTARASGRPGEPLAECERGLVSAQRGDGYGVPGLAIVGASFTAGVGPNSPARSWAMLLARHLHWDAVVYGDPGAGYVRTGLHRQGPMTAEVGRIDLRALKPTLVIVQAGHDDIGVPASVEQRRVEQTVTLIHAEAPQAQIALLTVFAGRSPSPGAYRTDEAIVTAGRAADHSIIIMDPLAGSWTFARAHQGLHPSASGDASIASKVAGILSEHGVHPAPAGNGAIACDDGVGVPGVSRV
jgi:acyl-CoA thioesterase I